VLLSLVVEDVLLLGEKRGGLGEGGSGEGEGGVVEGAVRLGNASLW
jgi:hypothetical protein